VATHRAEEDRRCGQLAHVAEVREPLSKIPANSFAEYAPDYRGDTSNLLKRVRGRSAHAKDSTVRHAGFDLPQSVAS
jgi:hypothetical protein